MQAVEWSRLKEAYPTPPRLRRLLYAHAELDHFSAPLRRNPRHFSMKAGRDVELDHVRHRFFLLL